MKELVVRDYDYYPGDCDEWAPARVAFLPKDIMHAFQMHSQEDEDLGIDYINKVLSESGYDFDDDDIFYYMDADDYRRAIINRPHDGDVLVESMA